MATATKLKSESDIGEQKDAAEMTNQEEKKTLSASDLMRTAVKSINREEKIAAIKDKNIPTQFLLYLHTYDENRAMERHFPYVVFFTDEIRRTATDELFKREWKLTEGEKQGMHCLAITYMEELLHAQQYLYEVKSSATNDRNAPHNNPILEIFNALIDLNRLAF